MAVEIPKMQWAQVFAENRGPIELKQIPVPVPGPDEVLVNIKYTGGKNRTASGGENPTGRTIGTDGVSHL